MAGLYMIGEEGRWEQSCGGTLISSHLVLTGDKDVHLMWGILSVGQTVVYREGEH